MTCANASFDRPANFRYTNPFAIGNRYFNTGKMIFYCLYLHFYGPAIIFILHIELEQLVPPDGSEWSQICKMVIVYFFINVVANQLPNICCGIMAPDSMTPKALEPMTMSSSFSVIGLISCGISSG